jgi:hypothetical protein
VPPSPPSTFCQEKVTTSSLAKSMLLREGRGRGVADGQALAVRRNEVGIRNDATPEVVPFQVKTTSRSKSTSARSGGAIGQHRRCARPCSLQLLDDVGHPAGAEAFPGQHVDAALAEQRPQRHLDGAGIGSRHDADAVVGRHVEELRE